VDEVWPSTVYPPSKYATSLATSIPVGLPNDALHAKDSELGMTVMFASHPLVPEAPTNSISPFCLTMRLGTSVALKAR